MSAFVTIIETQTVKPVVTFNVDASQLIKSSRIIQPLSDQHRRYWIGLSSDPAQTRNGFARSYPFAFFGVVHAIRAENRSEMLNEALKMKLREKHIIHGWYELTFDDIAWLRTITDENMREMIPQIENALAAESGVEVRDVTKRKRCAGVIIVAEEPNIEDVEALKQRLLEQADAELY
jgi:hypothetical protein